MLSTPAEYLKTAEVADKLRTSGRTVSRLAASGELPSIRIGKSRLFRSEAVAEFVARREARGA